MGEYGSIVENKTKRTTISRSARVVLSAFSKAKGLMFSFRPRTLIMRFSSPRIVSLHMFFVFYPIDVLWIAEDGSVVETLESFRPFSLYTPHNKAVTVVEMPAGTIKRTGTRCGDMISLQKHVG